MSQEVRAYIYRIFLALLVLGTVFNIFRLTDDQAGALKDFVSLLVLSFPIGLAVKNTSTEPQD